MTLEKDAERIAAAIEENFAGGTEPGVRATVQSDKMSPKSIPAGAGRPLFINYYIHIEDGKRKAVLNMGQAGGLRDEIESDWDVDRLFDAIRGRDVEIEDVG
jgi:hypothetical protein